MLEAVSRNILSHLIGIEHFTVHRNIDTRWFALHRPYGTADIKYRIASTEGGG
jgi:hypothetical protein